MSTDNPRVPANEQETFAIAFMVGYLGEAPDELVHAFPEIDALVPEHLRPAWTRGYDSGVAFFSDHALDEEG